MIFPTSHRSLSDFRIRIFRIDFSFFTKSFDLCIMQKIIIVRIKILGSGCVKCMELEKATRAAVSELRLDYEIEHVTDFAEIAGYGVMTTPALVFNGEVISYGKVLTVEEVKALLSKK